eukprot:14460802-Ditylum_brightwellii.AAC.1
MHSSMCTGWYAITMFTFMNVILIAFGYNEITLIVGSYEGCMVIFVSGSSDDDGSFVGGCRIVG